LPFKLLLINVNSKYNSGFNWYLLLGEWSRGNIWGNSILHYHWQIRKYHNWWWKS